MNSRLLLTRRLTQLLIGLFAYGIAISMMVRAGIGVSPWDVLAQGLSLKTGIPFGLITNIVGLVVLLFWIPLRQRPGLGTVLNVLLIGPAAQLGLWLIPQQTELWAEVALFTGGLLLLAVATGLYIGPRMGPGPRDGLMTGLHARTGWPIWSVRTGIEVTVLIIGWILGGNLGVGTLAFALLIGPLCSLTLPLFAIRLPEAAKASSEERELEGSAEQATQYDLREGIFIESDAASHDRVMRRATSSTIGANGPDRARPVRRADARTIAAYWLDDRLFGSARRGRPAPAPHH
ncbi:membrane protein [Diaminobutyricibacter tongyongensis]|uniref:Membrane protein n=1 Tax=Leifsonia tongyongensis TaxID=1268043 RepID=A0A6L9XU87_9MICO|nr:membrane protein [Diaminobutyricibacter tongyongensis]